MDVFTPNQRELHILTTMHLMQSVQAVKEVEDGYQFSFPNETELLSRIAEFISKERLCCPFLEFSLHVTSSSEPISLSLVGPAGTQDFLRAEFGGAIP
jgi:hypothetical protein